MKKSKKDKKKIFAAALAIFLAALMLLGSIAPFLYASEIKGDIEVTAEVGYSGMYKPGYPTLVKVFVRNNGSAFKGEVQIKSIVQSGGNEKYAIHSKEIEISEGSSQEIEIELTMNHLSSYPLLIEVVSGNKVLYSQDIKTDSIDPNLHMGLVISDSPENLHYLRNMSVGGESVPLGSRLVFGGDNLPEKADLLSIFSFIIINDFDGAKLSAAQIECINEYINSGGAVLLGTGANYYKALPYFSQTDLSEAPDMGIKAVTYSDTIADEIYLALDYAFGDKTYYCEEGYPFANVIYDGSGALIVLSYDLGTSPANKKAFYDFEANILTEHFNIAPDDNYYWSYISNSRYYTLPDIGSSAITGIFVIIGNYIILIGPILYIILKKKDRREYGFVIIPAVAVVITALIYVITLNTPFKKPILNKMNFIYLDSEKTEIEYETSMGYLYHKAGDWEIQIANENLSGFNINPSDGSYYYPASYGGDYGYFKNGYKVLEGERFWKAKLYDAQSWETTIIAYKGKIENRDFLKIEYYETENIIKGTLINDSPYDYEDVILKYGSFVNNYGDLKRYSQIDFEIDKAYFYTRFFPYTDSYSYNLLRTYSYYQEGYQENEIKHYNLLELENKLITDGRIDLTGGQLIVYAFNSEEMFNEDIIAERNKRPVVFNRNVFSIIENIPVDITEAFSIDYGLIEYAYVYSEGEYYEYEKPRFQVELYTAECAEAAYSFEESARITEIQFLKPDNYFDVTYQIFNYSKSQYEEMKFTPYRSNIVDRYLNDAGIISIRILPEQTGTVGIPQIRIEGGAAGAGN